MKQHPIHYRVSPSDPAAHLFLVELTVFESTSEGLTVSLPAWIPGSYMIRDFAKNIVTIEAWGEDRQLALNKIDKQTWQIEPCNDPVTVTYTVYAWDLSVRSAHFDQQHAYFNGTSLFLRVHGQDERPCSVELLPPEHECARQWRVATTLTRNGAELYGFGGYQAADYDELIDHPVEMADFTLIEFEARGTPHAVAISGRHFADCDRIARDLKSICEYEIDLFGELPEMERYLFMVMAVDEGYGGLEHRSSTSLLCSRDDLPQKGDDEVSEGYRTFLGLCSHEYFHTWNVKRIKPAAYLPYELQQEVHTPLLWFFEGITSYYDDLTLYRSGCINKESYLELLGQQITRLLRTPGRNIQTVSESSFDTWTKLYKADENAPNGIVSYYNKGALVALYLDLTIRKLSNNEKSLDDVMRALWSEYGKPLIGLTTDSIESAIEQAVNLQLKPYFDEALRSTRELPLPEILSEFGIQLNLRAAISSDDKGGKSAENDKPPHYTGLRVTTNDNGVLVNVVLNNSPAHHAGISAADIIIAVDGLKCGKSGLEKLLSNFAVGDKVTLHGFRRDILMSWELTIPETFTDTAWLTITDESLAARWLQTPLP